MIFILFSILNVANYETKHIKPYTQKNINAMKIIKNQS